MQAPDDRRRFDTQLRVVGYVRTPYRTLAECPSTPPGDAERSRIEILPEYSAALEGIEAASHVVLLYWLGDADRGVLQAVTRVDGRVRGVFANRAPTRPNPIALAAVRMHGREGDALVVSGLDCLDGTPALDIKPYVSRLDCVPDATVDWMD